ncbi:DNA-binding response regulator [Citricoccus zhacaiensis]|uniref:DNA-binding response regulator n=1 Tax=Citricoccus zhacaiensis TaxID=489142 RepID=A0ABQ2LW32_9MICC|nr:response regulator transcription factor [Citricoccus zhacaiensis]GGO43909.1 DNA-binding response regulator [Citricoccus zhacaiensis]
MPDSSSSPLSVLIVDDQPLMSGALKLLVENTADMRCVGIAANGEEALESVRAARPNVVLMDMQMPVMGGVEATERITAEFPDTSVLAITTFTSEPYLVPALKAGAAGYLLKDADPETIISAIWSVHRGESVLSPAVTRKLLSSIEDDRPGVGTATAAPGDPDGSDLTPRELDVLRLLARGRSNPEIAEELHISESTVKANLSRIMDKLEVRDRVQVIIRAAQLGLVTLSLG